MTPKETIIATLKHEWTGQVPWVPFAGCHAGKLIGRDAEDMMRDGDVLFEALSKVNELYRPFGQPVMFDLQIEAECLGCELRWHKDAPPSVASHPLEGQDEIEVPCECTIPSKEDGRIPMVLDVMRRMKAKFGDTTALYGLVCGPFTLATHLRGNDIFMDMYDDPDAVKKFLDYCMKVTRTVAGYYIEAGMDVIAVVDPLISQISSEHFEEFMAKPFSEIFKFVRESGAYSSFFVCGDATRNIEEMCKTDPDSISIDENVDLVAAKAITDRYNVTIGGNIPLTTVMLHGTQQDNMKCVVDILDSVSDHKNLIIAPGCDMPYDVPIENTIGAAQAVIDTDGVRKMLENYVAEEENIEVELPDYANLKKPLIEVFTLDSVQCAACTYMKAAAMDAWERFGDRIDVVEYMFTKKENIARCKKMGVPNLPSMYINGELKFRSIVPSKEELDAAITSAIEAIGK